MKYFIVTKDGIPVFCGVTESKIRKAAEEYQSVMDRKHKVKSKWKRVVKIDILECEGEEVAAYDESPSEQDVRVLDRIEHIPEAGEVHSD